MKILHLTIKKRWFDKIASGEKKIEYREKKEYWIKRLMNKHFIPGMYEQNIFDEIHFKNGYKKDAPFMRVKHNGTTIIPGIGSDLNINKKVFAIHLGEILEMRNNK